MKTTKFFLGLVLAAAIAVIGGYLTQPVPVAAGTDTYDNVGAMAHDNLQNCITFSGADGGSGALTLTLPPAFVPRFAFWVENVTDGAGGAKVWTWVYGMGTGKTLMLTDTAGTDGFSMNTDADTDAGVATAGAFVIDDDSITDNTGYYGWICR